MSNSTNSDALCTAVFLSVFTPPIWVAVGCDDVQRRNYFICESSSRVNFTVHAFVYSNVMCSYGYTYVSEWCWKVSKDVYGYKQYFEKYHQLRAFLSAWSHGNNLRHSLALYSDTKRKQCLRTYDFSYQHFKDWVFVADCTANYQLLKRKPLIYRHHCQGTLST